MKKGCEVGDALASADRAGLGLHGGVEKKGRWVVENVPSN